MVIKATLIDNFLDVLLMAKKFVEASPYADVYSMHKLQKVVFECLTSTVDKAVFVSEHGMIAGMITEFIYGQDLVATELAWWVDPDHRGTSEGKELFDAFEQWARDNGCKYVTMISLDNTIGGYYEKRGYALKEQAYMRTL